MLRPAVNQIISKNESCYSLVIAVAKRAREISEQAEEEKRIITEKPVSIAIGEIMEGKYAIVEPEEIRDI